MNAAEAYQPHKAALQVKGRIAKINNKQFQIVS